MRGAGRVAGLLFSILVLAMIWTVPADAGPGVRLSHGEIQVGERLLAGSTYQLPTLRVGNPGDVASGYRMAAVALAGDRLAIPDDWLSFEPALFDLDPGDTQAVEVSLMIPSSAALGDYEGMLAAQLVAPDAEAQETAAQVGGGAAARLGFEVAAPTLMHALVSNLTTAWANLGGWRYVALGAAVVAGLFALARRFSIRIERRVPGA